MGKTTTVVQSRTNPAMDTISFPVLTYSDAAPRDDLRDIDKTTSQRLPKQGVVAQWDFPRPQTADTRTNRKAPPGVGATFDFRLTAPPDEAVPSGAPSGGSPLGSQTIGIALGSPDMFDSKALPPPRFNTSIFAQTQTGQPTPPQKSSKWKKIGGFFRAKNALASPTQSAHPGPSKQLGQKEIPSAKQQQMKKRKGSNEERPRIGGDPKTKADSNNSSSQRSRNFSLSKRIPTKENLENQSLRLELDIPDIQMERYSVMFSNVMNKNQRPNLLARRAKTLDSLSVPSNQLFFAATAKPPPVLIRRATSPARSSFTLFPTSQPSKAAQIPGTQNFSRGPSPLLRSNTVPVESPSRSPLEPTLRAIPNNNGVSSLESPITKQIFNESSNTPQSSNSYIRWEDKPLPPINPHPRSRKMSPQDIRAVQSSFQQQQKALQTNKNSTLKERSDRERRNLTVKTGRKPPLPPPKDAKDKSPSKSSLNSTAPPSKFTAELVNITASPKEVSSDPKPDLPNPPRAEPIRIPPVAEPEQLDTKETNVAIPTIEVSTARSISLKSGKRQVLVPVGSRVDHFNANERLVDRKALLPRITDVQYGHKHAVSQELQIESL
ncbi:uncharacterized protein N7498_007775 [Penicillium cinerascens]|uniref:Uncharacterized protein n=1 Tax=Penicillium cinerascens TaxID=70096 RepID=A0A9W9JKL1_9EURO|nr:uncharacterized protein N7498_007775 [Penicillium cinerascens]KAJ5198658.1 hypothetical protein N7498_007775 [Penicillium cinerascens]